MNFLEEAAKAVEADLEKRQHERHDYCAAMVYQWLMERASKKPVPDLVARLEQMRKDIYTMTESMKLSFSEGVVVVKATGSSEQTLKNLKFGTDWFEPNPEVETQIIAGLFESGS